MKCNCPTCSLDGVVVPGRGRKDSPIIAFITEAPKLKEVTCGEILSGTDGALVNAVLEQIGVNPKDCYFTSALKCPIKGNAPKVGDMDSCVGKVIAELHEVKPKAIVAMGTTVYRMLFGEVASITQTRGYPRWDNRFSCYIIPTYQPGAIWRNTDWFPEFAWDIKKAYKTLTYPKGGVPKPKLNYVVYDLPEHKEHALQALKSLEQSSIVEDNIIACDIETGGFDYFKEPVLDIGFAPRDDLQYIFSVPLIEDPEIQDALNDVFKYGKSSYGWQNGKFDCGYLKAKLHTPNFSKNVWLPNVRNDFDTMLAHFEIDERKGTHGLKVWAKEHFDAPDWEANIKEFLPNASASYANIPKNVRHKYLAHDLYYTRCGMKEFPRLLAEEGTEECFRKVLMPVSDALTDIELRGVQLHVSKMKELYEEALPKIEEARKHLENEAVKIGWDPLKYAQMKNEQKMSEWRKKVPKNLWDAPKNALPIPRPGATEVPKCLNPHSSPQMQWVAYDLCNMPLFEGKKTCCKEAVEAYQFRHPFWRALNEYKDIADLFGIYIKGMLERVDPDGRIRPDFFLTGTVTGRISCHDPNLQNLPRKSIVKDFFIANNSKLDAYNPSMEETVIVNCDYKTLEVVIAAILSDDPIMKQPFINGEDYHTNTMKGVFASHLKQLEEFSTTANYGGFRHFCENSMLLEIRSKVNEMCDSKADPSKIYDHIVDYLRFLTKFITFGIMYGRKARSLAEGELQCSVQEAQKYIDNFLMTYRGFWRWQKRMQQQAKELGYVQTIFGHKRRWHLTTSDTAYLMDNQAVNTPIQGSAAQFCLVKVAELHRLLTEKGLGWVIFTVHDSIVFEIKRRHLQTALSLITTTMETPPFETDVPFKVDAEVGPTYKQVESVVFKDGLWVPKKPEKCTDWLKEMLNN